MELGQAYFLVLVKIALVSAKGNDDMGRCVGSDVLDPVFGLVKEGVSLGDVVHDKCNGSISVIDPIDCLKPLTASCIP